MTPPLVEFVVSVPDTPENRARNEELSQDEIFSELEFALTKHGLEGVTVRQVEPEDEICRCQNDWTDGTEFCQECGKRRVEPEKEGRGGCEGS